MIRIAFAMAAMLLTAACSGSASPRRELPGAAATGSATPASNADLDVPGAAAKFAAAASYRLHFTLNAPELPATIAGDAAYRGGDAVYAHTTFATGQPAADDLIAYLFLPPDLYLQQGSGGWLVKSPWDQGSKPGQASTIGLQRPVVEFADVARYLRDVARLPDESVAGHATRHFGGSVDPADVPSLAAGGARGSALVEVWIDAGNGLPVKLELRDRREVGVVLTLEFSDYGVTAEAPAAPADARPLRDAEFPDAACIGAELAGCLEAQTAIRGEVSCGGGGRRVCLAPLGKISPDLVANLVQTYREQYGLTVTVLTPAAIPAGLEETKRQQIDADRLIEYMGTLFPAAYQDPEAVLIGITPVDLYMASNHYRYVFGVKGTPDDPKAVVSVLRMNPQFYSEAFDGELFYSRARKLVSKYLGLLYYGLPPSPQPTSPLYDSIGGPSDVDRMTEPLPVARR